MKLNQLYIKLSFVAFLIILFVPGVTLAQTYVPDDNFEQALIDQGYDDVLDDYVLTENISDLTTLNVNGNDSFV